MNSLKTIYSRITTMKPARDALEEVGVALYEIGENGQKQVKPITSILNNLSEVWWDLTDAQRQNLSVTLAGRFQLARFLGMMNNYDIAIDATRTAVTSHGSAMRENAEYLKSYEARINQLKTAFTEFSSAVGDAVLSGAMTGLIRGLIGLAESGAKVVSSIGVLPVLFLGIYSIAGKMGVFDKFTMGLTTFFNRINDIKKADGVGVFNATSKALGEVSKKSKEASSSVSILGTSFKTALVMTGIGVAIAIIGTLIEKMVSARNEQTQLAKDAKEMTDNMITSYRSYADGMEGVINRYDELSKKQARGVKMSVDEQSELAEVTAEIANALPVATKYIDANGEAHLKTTGEIMSHVKAVEDLSKAQRDLEILEFSKNVEEMSKEFEKTEENIRKTKENIAEMEDMLKKGDFIGKGGRFEEGSGGVDKDGNRFDRGAMLQTESALIKTMALDQADLMRYEAEKTEHIQNNLRLIESQVLAYFEAGGQLSKLSESQLSVIEGAVSMNEHVLRNYEDLGFEELDGAVAYLENFGKSVGEIFTQIYDEMENRAGGDPLKLEDMKHQLDVFAQAIPDDLFKLNEGRTVEQMRNITKEMANVSEYVRLGHDDFGVLRGMLERAGMSAQDAGYTVHRLSKEYQNASLDAQAFTDEAYNVGEGLDNMNDIITESIDLTKELFGYTNEELGQISEFAGQINTLKATYGESYKEMQPYKDLISNLATVTGVSTEEAEKNAKVWGEVAEGLSDLDQHSGKSFYKQVDEMEGVSKKAKEMLKEIIKHGGELDAFTRVVMQDIHGMNDATYDEIVKLAKEAKMEVNAYIEDVGALFDKAGDLITEDIEEDSGVSKKAKETLEDVEELKEELDKPITLTGMDEVYEKFGLVGEGVEKTDEKFGELTETFEAPISTDSLDSFMEGISEGFDTQVDLVKATAGTIFEGVDFNLVTNDIKDAIKSTLGMVTDLKGSVGDTHKLFDDLSTTISDNKLGGSILELEKDTKRVLGVAEELAKKLKALGKDTDLSDVTLSIINLADESMDAKIKYGDLVDTVYNSLGELSDVVNNINNISESLKDVSTYSSIAKISLMGFSLTPSENLREYARVIGILAGNFASATTYGRKLAKSQISLGNALERVSSTSSSLESDFKNMTTSIQIMFSTVSVSVVAMTRVLISEYSKGTLAIALMREDVSKHLSKMVSDFAISAVTSIAIVRAMTDGMYKELNDGVSRMADLASSIPQKIGNAIVRNMGFASSAMDSLAKSMVSRFKKELGIQSPSRVFTDLGGWVIQGLVNGLTGSDLTSLGQNVFSDFGGGALSSWEDIKSYLTVGSLMPNFGGSFRMTSGFGMRKNPVTGKMRLHAGTDYGAPMGTPIKSQASGTVIRSGWAGGYGNMVEIQGAGGMTYRYAHNSKNTVRVGDVVGKGQVVGLVGSTGNSTGPHVHYEVRRRGRPINALGKFAEGGFVENHQIAEIGEEGLEAVIPLISKRRDRGISLWKETGALLGIDPLLIDILTEKNLGGQSSGFGGMFHALSGESSGDAGASGGADGGTSGILRSGTRDIISSLDAFGDASFTALKKSSSKKKAKVELDDLYKPNLNERQITIISGKLKVVEERMKRITEHTLRYRRSLEKVVKHNNDILKFNRRELKSIEKRNKSIKKQLNKLKNVNKHSEKQRKRYNDLMQEYDSNISKVSNLKGEIESLVNAVKETTRSIFENIVDGLISNINKGIEAISDRIGKIDFKLEVISLTTEDPNEQIKLIAEKGREHHREIREYERALKDLEYRLEIAVRKYGYNSDVAIKIKEEMRMITKAIDDTVIHILRAEKEIRDIRGKIADDIVGIIQNQYKAEQKIRTDAIDESLKKAKKANDEEMKMLEDSHKDKMKIYDEQIKKINEIYDARIRAIDDESSKDDYEEQLSEYVAQKQELENRVALLSRNDTLDDKKRLADSKKELEDLNKEMDKFVKNRHKDLLKDQLNDQKDSQIKEIESRKETEDEKYEISKEAIQKRHDDLIDSLEDEKTAINTHYDSVIEDEERWARIREELLKGNFNIVSEELKKMGIDIEQFADGTFDTLSKNFGTYSDEVRNFVREISNMISQINSVTNISPNLGSITPDGNINEGAPVTNEQLGYIVDKAFSNTPLQKPTPEKQYVYDMIQEFMPHIHSDPKQSQYRVEEILKKAKSNKPLDVPTPEKQILYSIFQDILKRNGARFDTGGYTGNWSGNDGKMAILHKKELVLNERQTKDILNTAKIMEQISSIVPSIKRSNHIGNLGGALESVTVTNTYDLDVYIGEVTGDKKGGETVVDEIMKGVRKMKG